MPRFVSTTCILVAMFYMCFASNPGMKVQLTQKALDYGLDLGMRSLLSHASSLTFPDFGGSATLMSQEINYELSQIKLVSFYSSKRSAVFNPGKGIQISIQGENATITSNWRINSFLIKDSGSGVLTLKGISASMLLGLHQNALGLLSVSVDSCQSDIKEANVKLNGALSQIYDRLKEPMENLIRPKVNQQLCTALKEQIQQWNKSLNNLKLNISLDHFVGIDLSLISNPIFSEQYAELHLKGMFYSHYNKSGTALSPATMTFVSQSKSMLYVGISESSLNSASQSYYNGGFFNFRLSDFLISQNVTKEAPMQVSLSASSAPKIYLKPSNLTVEFSGSVDAFSSQPNSERVTLFSARTVVSVSANLSMSNFANNPGWNLTGSIDINRFHLEIEKMPSLPSTAEVFQDAKQKRGAEDIIKVMLMQFLNEKLRAGINIPVFILKNPFIQINQEFVLLGADANISFPHIQS